MILSTTGEYFKEQGEDNLQVPLFDYALTNEDIPAHWYSPISLSPEDAHLGGYFEATASKPLTSRLHGLTYDATIAMPHEPIVVARFTRESPADAQLFDLARKAVEDAVGAKKDASLHKFPIDERAELRVFEKPHWSGNYIAAHILRTSVTLVISPTSVAEIK